MSGERFCAILTTRHLRRNPTPLPDGRPPNRRVVDGARRGPGSLASVYAEFSAGGGNWTVEPRGLVGMGSTMTMSRGVRFDSGSGSEVPDGGRIGAFHRRCQSVDSCRAAEFVDKWLTCPQIGSSSTREAV